MRIAIDLSQIIYGTGVSHYRENLVKNLLQIDKENEYLLYGGGFRRLHELKEKVEDLGNNSKTTVKTLMIPPRVADLIWNKFHLLPIEKLIGKFDLVHTSDWAEPPSLFPKVTTIHDIIPLKFPRITPKIVVETHKQRLKWVLKESSRIIVPSFQTKEDLLELGFDENKIRVIYEAPNLVKSTKEKIDEVRNKYKIHNDYLIAIGTNTRKNIERIINAFHLSKAGKNLKLIIVGEKRGIKNEDQSGVRFVGHVGNSELEALLTGSKALVFPSIYEGLGVPILEAFNCEVPVITSEVGSMKEVSGGASVLVDPYDVNSIASGIEVALNTPRALITKGLKRIKDFSWKKCAEETLGVYREVIDE